MLFAFLYAYGSCPFADAPPVSGDEVIWKMLRWFHRVASRRKSVPPYDVLRLSIFLLMSDDLLYIVLSRISLVIIDVISAYGGSTRMPPLRFDPRRRWSFFVFVNDFWILRLALLVRVDVLVRHRCCVCVSIVGVTPVAL